MDRRFIKEDCVNIGRFMLLGLMAVALATTDACADTMTWKEEVVLHDGRKIIVERTDRLGGYTTIDSRERQTLDAIIRFTLPESNKSITWKTDFNQNSPEINSLNLLVLDIVNGIPYIAAYPAGCIAYNKWKRPNPPYVFFKHDGNEWKRISLEEFPAELSQVNVIVGRPSDELAKAYYTVEDIKELNSPIKQPEYQSIVREPIKGKSGLVGCEHMIPYGKGGWLGLDWFKDQPSYEVCVKFCEKKEVQRENCPCESLFKR
jgi:hypothetical protein